MVNHKRIRSKLPELLVDGPVSIKANLYKYQSYDYHLRKLNRKRPQTIDHVVREIARALEDLEAVF